MTSRPPIDRDTWIHLLRQGDPARESQELTPDDAAALRRMLVDTASRAAGSAAPRAGRRTAQYRGRWLLAAASLAVAGFVVSLQLAPGLRFQGPPAAAPQAAAATPAAAPAGRGAAAAEGAWINLHPATGDDVTTHPRQLQFATRGGTRVIWLIVPDEPQKRRP
jgi:hypothetical protein